MFPASHAQNPLQNILFPYDALARESYISFWTRDSGFGMQPGCSILNLRFGMLDAGFWIRDAEKQWNPEIGASALAAH